MSIKEESESARGKLLQETYKPLIDIKDGTTAIQYSVEKIAVEMIHIEENSTSKNLQNLCDLQKLFSKNEFDLLSLQIRLRQLAPNMRKRCVSKKQLRNYDAFLLKALSYLNSANNYLYALIGKDELQLTGKVNGSLDFTYEEVLQDDEVLTIIILELIESTKVLDLFIKEQISIIEPVILQFAEMAEVEGSKAHQSAINLALVYTKKLKMQNGDILPQLDSYYYRKKNRDVSL